MFDITQLDNVKTIRDFDDKYTAKMFGYTDVNAYYASATLHTKVDLIKTPVLALNAADDVFSPYEGTFPGFLTVKLDVKLSSAFFL